MKMRTRPASARKERAGGRSKTEKGTALVTRLCAQCGRRGADTTGGAQRRIESTRGHRMVSEKASSLA